jgi:hypothetical protein
MRKRLHTFIGSPLSPLFYCSIGLGYVVGICETCVKGDVKSTFS